MPSVVVFDLGKVLVDFDYSIAASRIAARSRAGIDHVRFFIDHSPLLVQYELGRITTRKFFEEVRTATGFSGSEEEFSGYFADIFTPIEAMVSLQSRLSSQGVPTCIFSNTNDLAVSHIRRNFPFFGNFEEYILSYEHGAMKPDSRLYEIVEGKTRCRGSEIVYVDDRPDNVAAGAARGWHAVMHVSPEKTKAALEELGVLKKAPRPARADAD